MAKKAPKKVRKKHEQAEILLKNLGKALNACEKQNIRVKLRQGIVFSKYGYVLPFNKGWAVRMFIPGPGPYDDDDDLK